MAKSGRGLDVLVSLGDWEAVRLHLQSCAEGRSARLPNEDPVLKWYRTCKSFGFDEQLICLQIYNKIAPQLLDICEENKKFLIYWRTVRLNLYCRYLSCPAR